MSVAVSLILGLGLVPQAVTTTFATTETNKPKFYSTSVKLPTFAGGPLADFATVQLKKAITVNLAAWKKENLTADFLATTPRVPSQFMAVPSVSMATPDLISMYFQVMTYEGGAHPMTVFDSHTYAMVGGKPMEVHAKDLFNPDSKFVDIVSSLVIGQLLKNPDATWVQDGTVKTLTPQQVDSFVITPTTITYLLNPYDMGPYSSGAFKVKVPFTQLVSDLNKSGPLASVLK